MNEGFSTSGGALRIGIDARMLRAPGGTGVSTYARSLLAALPLIACSPVLIADDGPRAGRLLRALPWAARKLACRPPVDGGEVLAGTDIFRVAQVHFDLYGRTLPLRAPGPPGIMHWTYPVPLHIVGWRNVYTVHDAIPLDQPELTPIDAQRHARLLRAVIARAAALVTVSEHACAAIIAATGCPLGFVTDCAQPAIVPATPPPAPIGFTPGGYFLFCGSIEPRKNLERLASAYRASGTALPLLLVGPDGWRAAEVIAAVAPDDRIVRMPYQRRESLIGLIAHARAMLFPSLAEGFGLPVAEAMALGTPVMTSSGGALEETAGGAALTVPPTDVAAMAAAIARLAADDALVADLSVRGRVRAEAFALPRFAARLGSFYEGLIASAPGHPYQPPT